MKGEEWEEKVGRQTLDLFGCVVLKSSCCWHIHTYIYRYTIYLPSVLLPYWFFLKLYFQHFWESSPNCTEKNITNFFWLLISLKIIVCMCCRKICMVTKRRAHNSPGLPTFLHTATSTRKQVNLWVSSEIYCLINKWWNFLSTWNIVHVCICIYVCVCMWWWWTL